ncbi:hypothetical protein HGRIS_007784 [Hohenbuehelia grisea]|uniref:Ribosome biogenesis protein SLX9 n=1 Tax=Hohenbuehelia grisea TaxID=104357 RepID=A0ABR3J5Y4_9AGAR
MPKAQRRRLGAHAPSVKLAKRQFAAQDGATLEHIEIGAAAEASGNQILEALNEAEVQPVLKKKEKQQLKHEVLMQKLEQNHSPYSKSHNKRLKRKAREQVAGGMNEIQAVISSMDDFQPSAPSNDVEAADAAAMSASGSRPKPKLGLIGEGKGVPLTKNQRKRALVMEKMRQPLIRSNPEFSSNPFQTIRTHAQNTLLKHTAPPA